jgi:hypothetical protein
METIQSLYDLGYERCYFYSNEEEDAERMRVDRKLVIIAYIEENFSSLVDLPSSCDRDASTSDVAVVKN